MVKRLGRRPGSGHHLHRLFKAPGRFIHRDGEFVELSPLVPTPHPQIQTPIAEHVHRCRLLRELDRVMEGQHGHSRTQTNQGRHTGQVGQDRQRGRHNAMPGEVVFGEPHRVKAELLGPQNDIEVRALTDLGVGAKSAAGYGYWEIGR